MAAFDWDDPALETPGSCRSRQVVARENDPSRRRFVVFVLKTLRNLALTKDERKL